MAGSLAKACSEGLLFKARDEAARRSYIDFTLTAWLAGLSVGLLSFGAEIAVEIDLRSFRVGLPILELWSLTKALGGVYIVSRGATGLSLAGVAGFPGGLKGRLLGLGARPEDSVEGVFGRELFKAEAGRAGGPIEPLLFTVLDLLRVGDGAGEICDMVSMVLSDSDGRGLRFIGLAKPCSFPSMLVAFSFPSSRMAESSRLLGGVVSKVVSFLKGDAVLVGEMMPSDLLVQPNDGLITLFLLSPSGRIPAVRDEEVVPRGS